MTTHFDYKLFTTDYPSWRIVYRVPRKIKKEKKKQSRPEVGENMKILAFKNDSIRLKDKWVFEWMPK